MGERRKDRIFAPLLTETQRQLLRLYNPSTGKCDLSEEDARKNEAHAQASSEAAERQWQERLALWRSAPLEPDAKKALGNVSPDLAWLQVGSMVYHAADQYQPEAQAAADELNLDMDFASLHELLAEMNPVCGINEFHRANPYLNLQNLTNEPALKVLESVIQMLLYSDSYQASADLDMGSTPNSSDSSLVGNWTPTDTAESRADSMQRNERMMQDSTHKALDKMNSNSNQAPPTSEAVAPTPSLIVSSLRGNWTPIGTAESRAERADWMEREMKRSTRNVLREKGILDSNLDQKILGENSSTEIPSIEATPARADSESAGAEGPSQKDVLRWGYLEVSAARAFDVWMQGTEKEWARTAWDLLCSAGAADYANQVERHEVLLLFLALGGFYRDFCALAWEERAEPMYSYWAEELELDAFVLGQLVGPEPRLDSHAALNILVSRARPKLSGLLEKVFDGNDLLFCALWRTCEGDLTDDEILNEPTPDKMCAYDWLAQGAFPVLGPA